MIGWGMKRRFFNRNRKCVEVVCVQEIIINLVYLLNKIFFIGKLYQFGKGEILVGLGV